MKFIKKYRTAILGITGTLLIIIGLYLEYFAD